MSSPTRKRIAPSVQFVRSLEGKYYLLREAAELLGVSHRTLRSYNSGPDKELLGPSFFVYLGKIKIYLYTDDDIARIKKYLEEQKIVYPIDQNTSHNKGRPPKWTADQRKARQRKFSQVHYYKVQAEKHINNGDQDRAQKALRRMREIQKELKDEGLNQPTLGGNAIG